MQNKIIPISCDLMFKKMFGDPENLQRVEALLSIVLNIPYKVLKGKVQIVESEKRIGNKNIKLQRCDVVTKVNIKAFGKVNLEVNLGFNKSDIDRNVSFLTHLFNAGIVKNMKYQYIKPVIQINFNDYDVDPKCNDIIDKYSFRNKRGYELTDKLQNYNINIVKCYNIWYSKDIKKYTKEEQEIIKFSALLYTNEGDKFTKILGEINMEENIKKDIKKTQQNYIIDNDLFSFYGTPEEYELLEASRKEEQEERIIKEGKKRAKKMAKEMAKEMATDMAKDMATDMANEKLKETAKKMLLEKLDINLISKITGISLQEIGNLRQE